MFLKFSSLNWTIELVDFSGSCDNIDVELDMIDNIFRIYYF